VSPLDRALSRARQWDKIWENRHITNRQRLQAWRVAEDEANPYATADQVEAHLSDREIQEWCEYQRIRQDEIDEQLDMD